MSQLAQVTIAMLLFGLAVVSLGVWAARRAGKETTGTAKK